MTVIVSTPAALLAALKAAAAGSTILLAPGPWDPVFIDNYHAPNGGVVTIQSQTAANPAVLPGLKVYSSSGLALTNLTLATNQVSIPGVYLAPAPFVILSSQQIKLVSVSVHGTLDGNPQNDGNCLYIKTSDQISVLNSEFQQCANAITELQNTNITISGNNIHDIRIDGIDNGGSSYVTISGNQFSNFYPFGIVGGTGDHPDAIQFWTQGATASAHDITITGNRFTRGAGHWIQGIFVTDQVGLPYQHVTITGNTVVGGMYNGIMASGCVGLTVGGNVVQPYTDIISWVRVEHSVAGAVNDNHAGAFLYASDSGLTQSGDVVIAPVAPPAGAIPTARSPTSRPLP